MARTKMMEQIKEISDTWLKSEDMTEIAPFIMLTQKEVFLLKEEMGITHRKYNEANMLFETMNPDNNWFYLMGVRVMRAK